MLVGEILDEIMETLKWKQGALAKKIGVSQGTISKWRSGDQSPVKRQWDEVESLIRKEPRLAHLSHLIPKTDEEPAEVAVMGKIGAGAVIEPDFDQTGKDGLYTVSLPFAVPDEMIALEVDGESMLPKYDPGDVIVVWREQRRNTESFIGQLAAVRTERGRRYLKTILKGSEPGLYRLESFNAKPIEDVSIQWVGEIHVIVPASQVRHIGNAKKAAATRKAGARAKATAGMKKLPL